MDRLPFELIGKIVDELVAARDVSSLGLASKAIHQLVQPHLELRHTETIRFSCESWGVCTPNHCPVMFELLPPEARLRRTRRLHVQGEGYPNINHSSWCYHSKYSAHLDGIPEYARHLLIAPNTMPELIDWPGRHLAEALFPVLKQAAVETRLKHFGWDLGACIPHEILGQDGWLGRAHPGIQSLKLDTHGACPMDKSEALGEINRVILVPFRELKSLSWTGIASGHQIEQASLAIRQNAPHLEKLELKFAVRYLMGLDETVYPPSADARVNPGFVSMPGYIHPPMPVLRELRLAGSPLTSREALLASIDFESLTCLSILDCHRGGLELLQELVGRKLNLNLQTFEFSSKTMYSPSTTHLVLAEFLRSFSGLENLLLYVSSTMPDDGDEVWRAAFTTHAATLRRLAYWGQSWQYDGDVVSVSPGHTLGIEGERTWERIVEDNPLRSVELESISFLGSPEKMTTLLGAFKEKQSLKLIHYTLDTAVHYACVCRPGTSELAGNPCWTCEFSAHVDWVFTDDGVTSLQVVALGVFSNGALFLRRCRAGQLSDDGNDWELFDPFKRSVRGQDDDDDDLTIERDELCRLVERNTKFLRSRT